jgi:predicted ATPase
LFTDVEGSTRLWEVAEASMRKALAMHDTTVRSAVEARSGVVFATGGDGFGVAFGRAAEAVAAAVETQAALAAVAWPTDVSIRVRIGLHTGEADERAGDYFGPAVNRAARLMSAAHGGQVVCSQTTADLLPPEVTLVDLGEHRLRDLSALQHVYQVGAGTFPALRSLGKLAGNLPVVADEFVGRRPELDALVSLLGRAQLVTLVGVGGVGKTRLALHVAAEVAAGFPGGVWWVELGPVRSGDLVAPAVAAAIGIVEHDGVEAVELVVEALEARRLLVVLDNCEHVLGAVGRLADLLLRRAPGMRILATSREALGVQGEHQWPVGALAEAVDLFAVRAQAVRPNFAVDDATAEAVEEICRRLDGMPLAIELAAARTRSLTPKDIAGRLDERFRLLMGGRRVAVDRHQTLRAAIDWSFDLLDDNERWAFAVLSVFAGGCSVEAAEAVLSDVGGDGIAALDLVDSLVAKSLVVLDDSPAGARYRLLETLRQYAREQLDGSGASARAEDAHAAYYRALAGAVDAGTRGGDDLAWQARYDTEQDNFRAAISHLATGRPQEALAVVLHLSLCAWMRGAPDETDRWLRELIVAGDLAERAQALGVRGMLAPQRGDWTGWAEFPRLSLELTGEAGFRPDVWSLVMRGIFLVFSGDVAAGLDLLDQASEHAAAIGDQWDIGYARDSLAQMLTVAGNLDRARTLAEVSVADARRHGNLSRLALALYASAAARDATAPSSVRNWIDAADACARIRLTTTEIECTITAGRRARQVGDMATALDCFRRALLAALRTGQHRAAVMTLSGLAPTVEAMGAPTEAAELVAIRNDLADRWPPPAVFRVGPYAEMGADFNTTEEQVADIDIAELLPDRPVPVSEAYRIGLAIIDRHRP